MINLDHIRQCRQLSLSDKEMLIEILKKQTIEERRKRCNRSERIRTLYVM